MSIESLHHQSPEAQSSPGYEASVPFVITWGMKQELADLGYDAKSRNKITPQEAHDIIGKQRMYQKQQSERVPADNQVDVSLPEQSAKPDPLIQPDARVTPNETQFEATDDRLFGTAENHEQGTDTNDQNLVDFPKQSAILNPSEQPEDRIAPEEAPRDVDVGKEFDTTGNLTPDHTTETFSEHNIQDDSTSSALEDESSRSDKSNEAAGQRPENKPDSSNESPEKDDRSSEGNLERRMEIIKSFREMVLERFGTFRKSFSQSSDRYTELHRSLNEKYGSTPRIKTGLFESKQVEEIHQSSEKSIRLLDELVDAFVSSKTVLLYNISSLEMLMYLDKEFADPETFNAAQEETSLERLEEIYTSLKSYFDANKTIANQWIAILNDCQAMLTDFEMDIDNAMNVAHREKTEQFVKVYVNTENVLSEYTKTVSAVPNIRKTVLRNNKNFVETKVQVIT